MSLPRLLVLSLFVPLVSSATSTPASDAGSISVKAVPGVSKNILLPPGPGNPRNSEGDFIQLKDGRVLFIYTHFTGGAADHSTAHLAGRYSSDGGLTWTAEDEIILLNEGGENVMSTSLLRLPSGKIALFYARKNSLEDCRPYLRLSEDEARTWSDPIEIIPDEIGYYVLNNDRVIQTSTGRLIMPLALHNGPTYAEPDWQGLVLCYYSDDSGHTWQRSTSTLRGTKPDGTRIKAQEPGVVELAEGRLLMWVRTDTGFQYQTWSDDGGDTWLPFVASDLPSPLSPASIKRIPGHTALMLVWNDHTQLAPANRKWRTPFAVALSHDEGKTWQPSRILEDDPNGWYCYTAIEFIDDRILLGHCAGDRRTGGLNLTQITSFDIDWLLRE
jgi:hypothetical protein